MVDTTCGSVLNVWKNVKRYAQDGFTSVIHGKYCHEETRATASQALNTGDGHYLVVLDHDEAGVVCEYIRHGGDARGVSRPVRARRVAGLRPGSRPGARRLRQPDDDAELGVAGDRRDVPAGDAGPVRRGGAGVAVPRVRHDLQRDAGSAGRGHRRCSTQSADRPDGGARRLQQQQHVQPRPHLRRAGAHVPHRGPRRAAVGERDPAQADRREGGSGDDRAGCRPAR